FKLKQCSQPLFVDAQELSAGVIKSKCIVNSVNPLIRTINTTNNAQTINICNLYTINCLISMFITLMTLLLMTLV
ncbi:hypothetical protein ACYT7O_10900, partial [Streptococcus pyogenes]